MSVFIERYRTISCIDSFEASILGSALVAQQNAIEPNYKEIIPSNLLRRMNKAQRLGVGCALSLNNDSMPDGIIVGSGIGCYSNSILFTKHYLMKQEGALSPTAFIQSTDNTIAGQIAVIQGNHGYNNTYIHKGVAFENALLDACLSIKEGKQTVLVGGVDEKLKEYDKSPHFKLGEGASFFILTKDGAKAKSKIDFTWVLNSDKNSVIEDIKEIIRSYELALPDIVLFGQSFTESSGLDYKEISEYTFNYSNLSGVYFTNSAFAMQLACEIIEFPDLASRIGLAGKRVLIVNEFYKDLVGLIYLSPNE